MPTYLIQVDVACSIIQLGHGHGMELISKMCPQCWGSVELVASRLLLHLSISGNDIEAQVGGDYPVTKCVCREI